MGAQPKKSSRLFIFLGVALTAISMIGVYAVAHNSSKSSASGTTEVLVAKSQIPAHTIFTTGADASAWLQPVALPSKAVPQGAFTDVTTFTSQMLNGTKQVTSETIYPNEPVLQSMFTNIGSNRATITPAFALKKGNVAISFEVSQVDESAGAIQPGDSVDLLASYLPTGGGSGSTDTVGGHTQTQYVLQDLKIMAIGPITPTDPQGTASTAAASGSTGTVMLTVQVPRQTALVIQHLKDFGGSWMTSVVLRSAYDYSRQKTEIVGGDWFFSRLFNNFKK